MRSWRLVAIVCIIITFLSQPGRAEYQAYEVQWIYEGEGIFFMHDNVTLVGNDTSYWREYVDEEYGNDDGLVTDDEIDSLISYALEWDWPQSMYFVLDVYRAQGDVLSAAYENATDPIDSTVPIIMRTSSRFDFIYDQNISTHTFHYTFKTSSCDDAYANFSFKVPEGWEITDVRWLEQINLSQDSRKVEGQAPWNQQIDISFKESDAPNMTIYYVGVVIIILILGPMGGYILKKKSDRKKENTENQKVEDNVG